MKKLVTLVTVGIMAGSAASSATSAANADQLNIFSTLAKKIVPSVVNISTLSSYKPQSKPGHGFGFGPDDFFRGFFGERHHLSPAPSMPKAAALGTGFIIDPSGVILTNNHVVAGADEIKIQFTESQDEKPTDGKVIGRDPELDVALIQVTPPHPLTALALGDSDALEVGEFVMAVGNPYGQGHSVSHGIVSAKGRIAPHIPLASYLQTDAPINPGNSGGPLLNLKGEVVGINNAIDARAQGISFAIPVNLVKKILPQLRSQGVVARGYIGATVGPLTPEIAKHIGLTQNLSESSGLPIVTATTPNGPADRAGVRPYDIITEINSAPVKSSSELIGIVTAIPVGQTVPIKILRSGKELKLSIKMGRRPELAAR